MAGEPTAKIPETSPQLPRLTISAAEMAPRPPRFGQVHPAAELFPMLSESELAALADDIKTNGLINDIVLMDDGTLLDGRNRLAACERADIVPRFRTLVTNDPVSFVVSVNLRRRQLTTGQLAMLGVELVPMYEAQADKGGRPTTAKPVAELPQVTQSERKSRERAAKVVGTSGRAVAQAKRVREAAPELAEKVNRGELALDRADRIVRDRESETRRIATAQAQRASITAGTTVDIRHGDFREKLADLSGVDAIITDPPYPHEFLPLLADLAAWSDKVLAPDGILAVLFGKTYLPEVFRLLDGHRPYRWTMCYFTPGPSYVSHAKRVHSNWKPVLVYGGGPRFGDVVRAEGGDADAKEQHHWGQDYNAFHTIVERLTVPGATVVDPFMGSGTTLLAAKALGRHAIGCDINSEHVATAKARLGCL